VPQDPLLAAVLEPRRRAILRLLAAQPLWVGAIAERFEVSRPAISQHLSVLRAAGLVRSRTREGRSMQELVPDAAGAARMALSAVISELPGTAPELALEVVAQAGPERVFELVTTGPGFARWLGVAAGTFGPVVAPVRVVFGWGQEGGDLPPDSSLVELRLAAAVGGTLVRLEHRGLPEAARSPHLLSWAHHLPRLAAAAR
jgi:DNA-binding transcriptional ArsR family regulator